MSLKRLLRFRLLSTMCCSSDGPVRSKKARRTLWPVVLSSLLLCQIALANGAQNDGLEESKSSSNVQKLEKIVVEGVQEPPPDIDVDPLDSANLIELEEISRAQATDVFDILRNIPGISVQGGVRTSGKTVSIRGFSDNEDVLIQIDGVSQNFEKYRYGSGVDIDPELLKEIAVFSRGILGCSGLRVSRWGGTNGNQGRRRFSRRR